MCSSQPSSYRPCARKQSKRIVNRGTRQNPAHVTGGGGGGRRRQAGKCGKIIRVLGYKISLRRGRQIHIKETFCIVLIYNLYILSIKRISPGAMNIVNIV
jgi:hypothetical protein